MYKIEKFRSEKNKQYYFRIVAENGKIVSASEGYRNRIDRDEIANNFVSNLIFGELKHFEISQNSVVVLNSKTFSWNKDVSDTLKLVKDFLKKDKGFDVTVMALQNGVVFGIISELEMNKAGWFRKNEKG